MPKPKLLLKRGEKVPEWSLSAIALQPFWGLVALAILTNAEAVQRFVGAARDR